MSDKLADKKSINKTKYKREFEIIAECINDGSHYFIAYDAQDESAIIRDMIKYDNDFILINTNRFDFFNSANSFLFNYINLDINSLFSNRNAVDLCYAKKKKTFHLNQTNNYIYFYRIPNIKYAPKSRDMHAYKRTIGKIMLDTARKYGQYQNNIILDNTLLLKFSDKEVTDKSQLDNSIILLLPGIGDFFITFSIVFEFLVNKNCNHNIIAATRSKTTNSVFEYMINLCYHGKVETPYLGHVNICFWDYIIKNQKTPPLINMLRMFGLPQNEAENMASYYKKIMLGEGDFDYYKHSSILKNRIFEAVRCEEKEYINSIVMQNRKNIGIQYFTGSLNEISREWTISDGRKWDVENIKAFIKKCRDNNINIIVLNSETYDPLLQEYCTKKLSIAGYAYLISKMDLVVGVDSSAGHIASFYDIPSITLWGQGSPLQVYGFNIGFRALRKNYSIVPKNKDISSIDYNTVYSLVEKFFANELIFKNEIITYQDSVDGHNMLYV